MSVKAEVAPYGTWTSPISVDLVSGSNVSFDELHVNPKTGAIYLVEGRPAEKGRCSIVELQGTKSIDIIPSDFNARSKVHEYGGGACIASPDGSVIFTDSNTSGVFRVGSSLDVQAVINPSEKLRYADFDVHPLQNNLILAIQEDHNGGGPDRVQNRVALINVKDKSVNIIRQGADFYCAPKFNHAGTKVCWVQWDHPDMPWTGSELWVADWNDGGIANAKHVAGKAAVESVGQPLWHEDGTLFFSSDRTGFSQLYRLNFEPFEICPLVLAGFEDADLTQKRVFSALGNCTYIALSPTQLIVTYTKMAADGLLLVDLRTSKAVELPLGLVDIPMHSLRRVSSTRFAVLGAEITSPLALYVVDITKPSEKILLKSSTSIPLSPAIYSIAKHITFPRSKEQETRSVAHAIFTPPHNPSFLPVPGTKPPVIVSIHGGPTGHVAPGLALQTQFWTSRGYAYVHVNYVGSTGYGRKYRDALNYSWGIKDVDDAASCLTYLSDKGFVDGTKAGIVGGSAGGYTVLQSLVVYPKLWAAGNSLYGIGNVKSLAIGTHKFESHYLFALMFPADTTEEEREKIYKDRSPCFHANKIESPLLLLQGDIDKVVPLDQAEEMERVLKEGGKEVRLVVFEGEGHGFRMRENVKTSIMEEEKLWRRALLGLKE